MVHDYHSINDVAGYDGWDIYVTLHGNILNLSDALDGVGVSDNNTMHVHCRLRGGSNKHGHFWAVAVWEIAPVGQCGEIATGVVRFDWTNPPTPAPWNDEKNKRVERPFRERPFAWAEQCAAHGE